MRHIYPTLEGNTLTRRNRPRILADGIVSGRDDVALYRIGVATSSVEKSRNEKNGIAGILTHPAAAAPTCTFTFWPGRRSCIRRAVRVSNHGIISASRRERPVIRRRIADGDVSSTASDIRSLKTTGPNKRRNKTMIELKPSNRNGFKKSTTAVFSKRRLGNEQRVDVDRRPLRRRTVCRASRSVFVDRISGAGFKKLDGDEVPFTIALIKNRSHTIAKLLQDFVTRHRVAFLVVENCVVDLELRPRIDIRSHAIWIQARRRTVRERVTDLVETTLRNNSNRFTARIRELGISRGVGIRNVL